MFGYATASADFVPVPRDGQIRSALVAYLKNLEPEASIFHELPLLRGEGRADVVCVGKKLCGFEIKSDSDSLRRLVSQIDRYQAIFERVTAVVASRHVVRLERAVPPYWGILVAVQHVNEVRLKRVRPPRANPHINAQALSRLLWKGECVRALRIEGVPVRRGATISELWWALERLPLPVLCRHVRASLRERDCAESGL